MEQQEDTRAGLSKSYTLVISLLFDHLIFVSGDTIDAERILLILVSDWL
jgi:hypothetical protein